ncbi:hypothetical protein M3Y95_00350300 [Aphelenchoides besseyi]|nr:hypothetical protein M3Y95_00350300 [Aphelenchoides besseyi]
MARAFQFAVLFSFFFLSSYANLRLQVCDEDFRQIANQICSRPGTRNPCFKFYFDVESWKTNYTQQTLTTFGQTCCSENGCLFEDLKKHCCLIPQCARFCYNF